MKTNSHSNLEFLNSSKYYKWNHEIYFHLPNTSLIFNKNKILQKQNQYLILLYTIWFYVIFKIKEKTNQQTSPNSVTNVGFKFKGRKIEYHERRRH